MDLDIRLNVTPPLGEVRLSGEVDLSNVEKIGRTVDRAADFGCSLVAMDMHDVTFIDCAGIGALIEARDWLGTVSSQLSVTRVSPVVARMMSLTETDALFGLPVAS